MQTPSPATLDALLAARAPVHLAGAGGVGMAGLAFLLRRRGHDVTACDAHPGRVAEWLRAEGVEVLAGHDPAHLAAGARWVVRSAAVPPAHPEMAEAARRGLPVFPRGEVLPRLLEGQTSVAIGGTHGKTTTSTFIAGALKAASRAPSWCIGGDSVLLGGVAGAGDGFPERGGFLVVEADESDGTIARYAPDVAVVTNIDFDHMEHFPNVAAFEACFRAFMRQTLRRVVYCWDDPRTRAVASADAGDKGLAYGFGDGAGLHGSNLNLRAEDLSFEVEALGEPWGRFRLPVPGRHNALNALATLAVLREFGLTPDAARDALAGLSLPRRRLERVAEARGIRVISDYGHHPREIAALVAAAAGQGRPRLIAVFQPHRYTRTLALGREFPSAFRGVSELVLLPVYAASETPLPGGTGEDLFRHFREQAGPGSPRVSLADSLEAAWTEIQRLWRPGDLFLVVGAGDVEKIAGWAASELAGT
jgi:UDP-N-acetylmuramate--alanine ligase